MASQLPNRSRRTSPAVPRGRDPRAPASRPASPGAPAAGRTTRAAGFTRHGIAAARVLAGIVAMAIGTTTSLVGGAALIGAGVAIWLVSWLYRVGVEGDEARAVEERARRYFDRNGRWPDA